MNEGDHMMNWDLNEGKTVGVEKMATRGNSLEMRTNNARVQDYMGT